MASGPFTLVQLVRALDMSLDDGRFYRDSGLVQPAKRTRTSSDDFAFQVDHIERLQFIQRALACGFTHEDIAWLVDPVALVTCGDVYAVARRRLEDMRRSGKAETPAAVCLARLYEACTGIGTRKDCKTLEGLSKSGC